MYRAHFGLSKLPFENVPDPVFFFDEGEHHRVRVCVEDSLKAGRGLMVVAGPIGAGKTTLSQMIRSDFAGNLKSIWIAEPPANSLDLFMFIAHELGITPASSERTFVIQAIRDTLLTINADGGRCIVIIDESHLLTDDTINGLRLLNNLEEGSIKLIQVLLLGQEELVEMIRKPELEAFRQRIATMEVMGKMNAERIREYISHRLRIAGGSSAIIDNTGWNAFARAFKDGSTPRVINTLCDRSLQRAFEQKKTAVDVHDVYEAAKKLGLEKEIFFYIVELKKEHGPGGSGTADMDRGPSSVPDAQAMPASVQDLKQERAAMRAALGQSPIQNQARSFPGMHDTEEVSLKGPAAAAVLSAATLIVSIVYYCHRAGSDNTVSCLFELIGL